VNFASKAIVLKISETYPENTSCILLLSMAITSIKIFSSAGCVGIIHENVTLARLPFVAMIAPSTGATGFGGIRWVSAHPGPSAS